ncbi:ATP-binding protein [Pseudomonas aeruginosa]|uniref:ATP-binding protein n=1 Tax=Pseudomonas aeruginosa TaxID=287 RepID=UPI000B4D60A2|nr:ATP-binding protein [Pseudomonas aeruginosa]ASD20429.1 transposase [Pseudomonas aeruginosa]MCG7079601.1 ATP-binding protein [Pseudomonas aeruginosa]MCG7087036.1 ATP-binding protein [Pseudomonas aeruginosa]MCG7092799.1 ATP-binding protein [Pseudomonas aeruginosa]MCG7098857.1 ATP-binding protein [Pseudomonas aeruginosa]
MNSSAHAKANYVETGMPQYDGNPLIECLPPILSDIDVVRCIGSLPPKPDATELELCPKIRGHGINRLKDVVIPLEVHLRLEDCFSQLVRYGYTARNPFLADAVRHRQPSVGGARYSGFKSSANIMTLIGLSGMGKTTALDAIARLYPQVIKHRKYKNRVLVETQVVWLKIDCPHDGSLRGFCAAFFTALDNALGTHKYTEFVNSRSSVSVMLQRISQLCKAYYVGALIVDEMQHLNSSRGGHDREVLLNFFVTLSNDAGVPLVYVGTNAMLPLFSGVLRNARRAAGMGEITFDRFSEDDPFWEHLVTRLWEYDWTGLATPLTDTLLRKIYDLSQGNTDFLVKLLMLAQRHVISEELEAITPQVLQQVYDHQMRMLHKPIEALRSGDPLQIADFEDMMPTKDQIAQMMSHDLARRARRADLALVLQGEPPAAAQKSPRKPVGRPAVAVSTDALASVHLNPEGDVQAQLLQRGWTDDDAAW